MKSHVRKQSQPQRNASLQNTSLMRRTIGSQSATVLPHEGVEGRKMESVSFAPNNFAYDFSRIPVCSKAPVSLQAKLMVNTPGDIYEQEADRVSEQLMHAPETQLQLVGAGDDSYTKSLNEQHTPERLQTKRSGSSDLGEIAAPPAVHEALRSSGQPLNAKTRAFFEPRFGHNFSHVRVHTDAAAAESARRINALAYTVGHDIVFGAGQYAPDTQSGRKLVAHELTHVRQQSSASDISDQRPVFSPVNELHGARESAAQATAAGSLIFTAGTMRTSVSPRIQRQKASGLPHWKERSDPDEEAQRVEALNIVTSERTTIISAGAAYKVAPEAIAGAILWEALENPYHRTFGRLGPGKVHPTETFGKSEAEKVEDEGKVAPKPKDTDERMVRLKQPKWAAIYIAAIMRRHADNYLTIAGVDISNNVGVLCTLYQGGHSEERAKKLAEKRKLDPTAQPQPGDEMGPWVVQNLETIKGMLNPGPRPH
jgi:hypothetical protein